MKCNIPIMESASSGEGQKSEGRLRSTWLARAIGIPPSIEAIAARDMSILDHDFPRTVETVVTPHAIDAKKLIGSRAI